MFTNLFSIALLFAPVMPAQFESASVLGSVHDPSGATIAGAKITLKNVSTGVTATAQTGPSGNYEFLTVKIGDYRVNAEAPGFQTLATDVFNVAVNSRQRVDLTMKIGAATETVTVTGAAALIESDSSDKGQVINGEVIGNIPLNGRNYSDLSLLVPGVQRSLLGLAGDPREGSFNVNGLPSSQNNFTLDGVDNNAYGTSNQGFSNQVTQVSPDAVAEFKVMTNNFSAEYGRAGGAVINASLRGGTNRIHGSVYEYLRNTELNAIGFFKPLQDQKPVLIQNQFGASVGGPIRRDRTFFFADYEGFRRISKSLQFASLPTLAQRQGIFTTMVMDPLTNEIYQNTIPANRISNFAKKVFADLPAPNAAGVNNFQVLPRRTGFNDKGDLKIDHVFGPRTTFFTRASHRKQNDFVPAAISGPSGGSSNGHVRVLNQQLTIGATHTPAANQLVEFRLGLSRTKGGKSPIEFGAPGMLTGYGITGIPEDPAVSGGLNTQNISGFTGMGRQNSNPQHQDPFVTNPRVNYSRIKRNHSLKFGYEYQAVNTDIEDFHPKYGQDDYAGQFSRPKNAAGAFLVGASSNFNISDFLFGARSAYSITNSTVIHYRQRMHFGYVQDDWKVTPKLTVNAGLRYEFSTPQYEADNRLSNFDASTNKIFLAKEGSIFDRSTVQPDRNNFAPRLGIAYSIDRKTVIRTAYGISYIQFNRAGGENVLSYNGPTIVTVTINQIPGPGFRYTQDGYPANLATPQNYNPATARVTYIPSDYRTPYVQSWHFTIQRELARNLLLDLAYVGNHGTKLMVLADWNQARPSRVGENLTVDQRRPIQGFSFIEIAFNGNSSTYNAFQAKLEKRSSRGLYLLNSFTWSKSIDFASGHLETANGDTSRYNLRDVRNERGLSGYDRPFNNTTTVTYALPKGHGLGAFVWGGWRASMVNSMQSGQPVNLTYGPAANVQVSTVLNYRPNVTGDPMTPEADRGPNNYLNKATSSVPIDVTNPYGNSGRNTPRSSPLYQADVRLQKDFPMHWEKSRVEFQAECFNLLNKTNFAGPASSRSAANFGTITAAYPARIIQFALRFAF